MRLVSQKNMNRLHLLSNFLVQMCSKLLSDPEAKALMAKISNKLITMHGYLAKDRPENMHETWDLKRFFNDLKL